MSSSSLQIVFERQENMANLLETIADSLPDRIDPEVCGRAARELLGLMATMHETEEQELFPEVMSRLGHRQSKDLVEKLRLQQSSDRFLAEEVRDELLLLSRGKSRMEPEALGYLLRGFFAALRRHVAHTRELLEVLHGRDSSRSTGSIPSGGLDP